MKTMVNETYSGASETLTLKIVVKDHHPKFIVSDSSEELLCEISYENLLVKHWARHSTNCQIVSEMVNPVIGTVLTFKRVQQFILRVANNDEEKKTYYTMEVCSYV